MELAEFPLGEALRYVTTLAGVRYRVEPDGVVVIPHGHPDSYLVTRRYVVPDSFGALEVIPELDTPDTPDPFTDADSSSPKNSRESRAMRLLISRGIAFEEGTDVIYNPLRSELKVTNTLTQHELIEAFVEAVQMEEKGMSKQVEIHVGPIDFLDVSDLQELGFEWLLDLEEDWSHGAGDVE